MTLSLITVPCLSDNYAFILVNNTDNTAAVIDVPEAAPINTVLDQGGWTLTDVLLTHHHFDHVQGLDDLNGRAGARVIGASADKSRLPALDAEVSEGDQIEVLGESVDVLDVSGHTIGHIAFHFPASKVAFTGDSLMAMGCGRLFEGKPAQMWESLLKLRALPADTTICSGHEYTQSNARFAESLEEINPALTSRIQQIDADRADGKATVPSLLQQEIETNPFLRADQASLMQAVGMEGTDPADVFAHIRAKKDNF